MIKKAFTVFVLTLAFAPFAEAGLSCSWILSSTPKIGRYKLSKIMKAKRSPGEQKFRIGYVEFVRQLQSKEHKEKTVSGAIVKIAEAKKVPLERSESLIGDRSNEIKLAKSNKDTNAIHAFRRLQMHEHLADLALMSIHNNPVTYKSFRLGPRKFSEIRDHFVFSRIRTLEQLDASLRDLVRYGQITDVIARDIRSQLVVDEELDFTKHRAYQIKLNENIDPWRRVLPKISLSKEAQLKVKPGNDYQIRHYVDGRSLRIPFYQIGFTGVEGESSPIVKLSSVMAQAILASKTSIVQFRSPEGRIEVIDEVAREIRDSRELRRFLGLSHPSNSEIRSMVEALTTTFLEELLGK